MPPSAAAPSKETRRHVRYGFTACCKAIATSLLPRKAAPGRAAADPHSLFTQLLIVRLFLRLRAEYGMNRAPRKKQEYAQLFFAIFTF